MISRDTEGHTALCSCRDFKNLNALFAIVMGLGNVAVSRLSLTWEKLPSKSRKLFTELEALIDPTRNHRAYRIAVGRLAPPIIPFMPLLIKGTNSNFSSHGDKVFFCICVCVICDFIPFSFCDRHDLHA